MFMFTSLPISIAIHYFFSFSFVWLISNAERAYKTFTLMINWIFWTWDFRLHTLRKCCTSYEYVYVYFISIDAHHRYESVSVCSFSIMFDNLKIVSLLRLQGRKWNGKIQINLSVKFNSIRFWVEMNWIKILSIEKLPIFVVQHLRRFQIQSIAQCTFYAIVSYVFSDCLVATIEIE